MYVHLQKSACGIPYGLLNSKHIRCCHTRRFFIIGISQTLSFTSEKGRWKWKKRNAISASIKTVLVTLPFPCGRSCRRSQYALKRGIAYLISGDYRYENNLRMIIEGRSEVGGNYLCGVATDEGNTASDIRTLADSVVLALEKKLTRPTANFYGVGGMKIFRDLIYVMQGLMKADHKFYKQNGIYDFPQKQKKRILQMKLVGTLIAIPSVQKKMKGQMTQYIIGHLKRS